MKSIRIYTDFSYIIENLEDEEIGRLFTAMLQYAQQEEVTALEGKGEFAVWPIVRAMLDSDTNISLCRIEE